MKVAVLYSGGKDSNYALFWALHQGWDVTHLVSVFSKNKESFMFHVPAIEITKYSPQYIGIPLVEVYTSGKKEDELEPLKESLSKLDIDGVISGARRSEYQRKRIDKICYDLGIKSFAPLWHKTPLKLMKEMVNEGYEMLVSAVAALGLNKSHLGRKIDKKMIEYLLTLERNYGVNIDGEGGEFETIVTFAPTFRKRIVIEDFEKIWEGNSGYIKIKKLRLVSKSSHHILSSEMP